MHEILNRTKGRVGRGALILVVAMACAMAVAMAVALPQPAEAADGVKVYRLYNKWNGKHFYTSSAAEKAKNIVDGWRTEGVAWVSPSTSSKPIYRLYNQWSHEHLYTADKTEYDSRVKDGWTGENVVFYAVEGDQGVPVHRLYNPWAAANDPSSHIFTADDNEYRSLLNQGWNDEKVAWYGQKGDMEKPLLIGSFFVDTPGQGPGFETVLCSSRNGYDFTYVSTPFTSTENPYHDPSIMYKDGYFYILSCANWQDGKFHPMISYSKDLRTWTEPEGAGLINGGSYNGIPLESNPFGIANFDVVAPEWFVDDNGDVYIIFCAGFYGANHGQPENDQMKPYMVKVDISNWGFAGLSGSGKPFPAGLTLTFDKAYEIRDLDNSSNYIDGSAYKENGQYYLIIKKDGINNQIYRNSSMSPTGWQRVNDGIAVGNEGPSLVNLDGAHLLYTDMIGTFQGHNGRTGIQVSSALNIGDRFSNPVDVTCTGGKHLRHGTVINLTGEAKAAAEASVG